VFLLSTFANKEVVYNFLLRVTQGGGGPKSESGSAAIFRSILELPLTTLQLLLLLLMMMMMMMLGRGQVPL